MPVVVVVGRTAEELQALTLNISPIFFFFFLFQGLLFSYILYLLDTHGSKDHSIRAGQSI